MIITIDGPAAAGKGTLSKYLSDKYHFAYFDTGMVYRAVGLEMVLNNIALDKESEAEAAAKALTFTKMIKISQHPDFRSDTGGKAASIVSAYPSVRSALLEMQRNFALKPVFSDGKPADGVIYDGRDAGTVVCPNADIKFFVTASSEVRAQRRYKEFVAKGVETSYDKVLADIISRDERDTNRTTAPLKPADDAIIFDTSDLSIIEVIEKAVEVIDNAK